MMSTHLKGDLYKCPESLGIGAPRETGPAVRRPLHSADEIVKNVAGGSQTLVGEQEIAHPAISAVHTLRNLIELMQCEVRAFFFSLPPFMVFMYLVACYPSFAAALVNRVPEYLDFRCGQSAGPDSGRSY